MTDAPPAAPPTADLAALARGGRINFFGFVLRLAARLPFLFIAGRLYGAEALGRFAYAVLIVEFAAQLATLGLKRGLAQQLAQTDKPHACVAWDALLVAAIGSAVCMGLLMVFPQAMFPNSQITGLEWLLPVTALLGNIACGKIISSPMHTADPAAATISASQTTQTCGLSVCASCWARPRFRPRVAICAANSTISTA